MKWLVVSKPLQRVYEFLLRDGYWLSTARLIVVYRVVGRQGVDCLFDRSHHQLCIEVVCPMRVIGF